VGPCPGYVLDYLWLPGALALHALPPAFPVADLPVGSGRT
jgi:hypothetical protein